MAAEKESQIVLPLTDGITETVVEEVAGGIVTISNNTRFTKLKGTVSKAPSVDTLVSFGALECGGLISNGQDSTVAYFRNGEATTARYSDGTLGAVKALDGTGGQNAYYPYPIVNAGGIPGGLTGGEPTVVVDSAGRTWFFSARYYNGSNYLFVTVLEGDRVVVSPQAVTPIGQNWCGATAQTVTIGSGVACWYMIAGGGPNVICARFLTIDTDGMSLLAGAQNTIATIAGTPAGMPDVTSNGTDAFAYLVYQTSNANLALLRINTTGFTITHTDPINGVMTAGDVGFVAVCIHTRSGGEYVTAAYSDWVQFTGIRHYSAATLSLVWQNNNDMNHGRVAVQPFVGPAGAFMAVAVDSFFTGNLGTGSTRTTFGCYDWASGALTTPFSAYWYQLHSRGGYRKVSDSAIYPYFPLQASNQTNAIYDTEVGYVLDPSIEIFTLFNDATATPVMRCGVDRVLHHVAEDFSLSSCGCTIRNNQLTVVYMDQRARGDAIGFSTGYPTRYVTFNLAPAAQPSYAYDERGCSLVASGLVTYWDGCETAEHCPLHLPQIFVDPTGGNGATNLTGTYSFTAVISWRDSNGLLRRSAPAVPQTITLAGTKPQIYVTARHSMRNGQRQEEYDIAVYATLVGGSQYFAQNYYPTSRNVNGCWHFQTVNETGSYNSTLYSTGADGDPLVPMHPPPALAAAIVGSRMWLVDAENPYTVWPSLIKQPDVAYEFAAELCVQLPPETGKALAVMGFNGAPVFFCERGILTIAGYGPNNSGQDGQFNQPQLLSTRGCRSRESVAQIPGGGAIYQADDGRFALIGPEIKSFTTIGYYDVGTPLIFPRENEIAYPHSGGFIAYNYLSDSWSKWNQEVSLPTASVAFKDLDGSSFTLLYAASTGTFYTVDSGSSASTLLSVERGWIAPESPQGDCAFREIWVHCINAGSHGILVSVFFDYNDTAFLQKAWTASELSTITVDGRYTIGMNLHATPARAMKVRVEEVGTVTGEAMQPLTLTVTYGASAGVRRRTLKAGALK